MSGYYIPSQGSHRSHHSYVPPVVYSSSHGHGGYAHSGAYYDTPSHHYGESLYVPTHSSRRSRSRSRSRSRHYPEVVQAVTVPDHSHHSRHHHHYREPTIAERIRRFFGFPPKSHYRHESRNSSWGFLGRSRRRKYVDARTGGEVDRHGRPMYRF